jgi:protein O-GlcNAc transferase
LGDHSPPAAGALMQDPRPPAPTLAAGKAAHKAGRLDEAEAAYRRCLQVDGHDAEALRLLGLVMQQRGRDGEAVELLGLALSAAPAAATWSALAASQLRLGMPERAHASCDSAMALDPGYLPARLQRAQARAALQRHADALVDWEIVLSASPDHAPAMVGRGNALARLGRPAEALAAYDAALAAHPGQVEILNNRGAVLRDLKRYADAAEAFDRLARARPGYPYVESNRLHSQLYACDWRGYDAQVGRIVARVRAGEPADVPFSFLAISDDAADQLRCARRYVADRFPPVDEPLPPLQPAADGRIRIAYLSADFHDHATCHLMAGLFEQHDRSRFRVDAVSFGPDTDDAMRRRIRPCFERFDDVRGLSDRQVAQRLRERGVDIAIDLKGFTTGNRCGILARRPAPLQVSYLGYPGTLGAPYVDYLMADAVVAPPSHASGYAELLVRLPGSYQVNDRARRIADSAPSRRDVGLPDSGFVFCCFNNNYKISPRVFAAWMRLLHARPDSVLWLLEDNADAGRNLRAEAARAGIAPERLVFAARLPLADHLARHRLADLFLDTLPCNAHTTASDALWAGLPVLTCAGGAFAARVGASLASAAGLAELVCADLDAYEALALELSADRERLAALRHRLQDRRMALPLFDTDAFRRHFEQALEGIWQRHRSGLPPAALDIAP